MKTGSGRIAVFVLASAALLVPVPDCFSLVYIGPKVLSDDANAVMIDFQQALRSEDWNRALSLCSQKVKDEAKKFKSPKVFLEEYLPLEEFLGADEFPVSGSWTDGEEPEKRIVKYLGRILTDGFNWNWTLEIAGHRWLIDFDCTMPLRVLKEKRKEASERWMREIEARRAKLGPKLEGLSARLTAAKREVLPGEPVLLRLELIKNGQHTLWYDHQQVAVNDPLYVTNDAGEKLLYVPDLVQTGGHPQPLKPGETAVLFKDLDLSKLYAIDRPGRYTVQWRGKGLWLMETEDPVSEDRVPMNGGIESKPVDIVVREVKE
jgi:hypothetical protein